MRSRRTALIPSVLLFSLAGLPLPAGAQAEPEAESVPPGPAPEEIEASGELEDMAAAEAAEFGPRGWPRPDRFKLQAMEGLQPVSRPTVLRQDGLLLELSSDWLRTGSARPGGVPEAARGRLRPVGFDIPMVINEPVERFLALLQGRGHATFHRWLSRTTRYYPLMRPILRQYGLPEDLVAVSLVESGLNFAAFSRARASGPWQFMLATGKAYGLHSDFWLDERRDFLKATAAAARHLKDLYARFGDWYLAWAAYNAGETRIVRALERTGARDFWELLATDAIREETKRYVPKIIAAALVTRNPEQYGFGDVPYLKPLEWEETRVEGMVDLKVAAGALGIDWRVLQELNPELRYWCSPPYLTEYRLRIPKGSRARFLQNYRPAKRNRETTFARHRLQPGETLSHVALAYRTSVEALMAANRISNPRRIRAGISLIVPVQPCGVPAARSAAGRPAKQPPVASVKVTGPQRYRIREGDSLWKIAQRYGTTVESIQRRNGLKPGQVLQPGTVLTIE